MKQLSFSFTTTFIHNKLYKIDGLVKYIYFTMLKRGERVDDNEENENDRRRGVGKLSGLGTKMEKLFRAAFRKDNISQSKQRLSPDMVGELNESEDKVTSNIDKRKKMIERPHTLGSSDWSSEVDFGSRTNLVKERTKSNENIHETVDQIRDDSIPILSTRKMRRLKRSENVQSEELESTSMNVVVDIHRESINLMSSKNNDETVVDISSDDRELEQQQQQLSTVVSNVEENLDTSLENSIDSIKRQRKRWSKQTSVILPPKRNSLSSTSVSEKSSNWMEVETPHPVPAPRLKQQIDNEEKNKLGLDNEAFESEANHMDQVLRIETEYGSDEKTQIEMRSVGSESDASDNVNALVDVEKLAVDHSEVLNIEEIAEIRRFSIENTITNREISSKKQSGTFTKRELNSISSKRRKETSRRRSKNISISDNSTSSMSDMQVIDKFHRREETPKNNKIKRRSRSTSLSHNSSTSTTSPSARKSIKNTKNKKKGRMKKDKKHEMKYISISIHRADVLVPDYITRHPMVIVHIVDEATGNYLKDVNKTKVDGIYLQPLITGIFDIKANESMVPYWDEELIFEYDFNAILNVEKNQVLILFEIVDLPSVADASSTYDQFGGHNCWYKIAWAFLKPVGTSGIFHVNKLVRLQLYKPKRSVKRIKRHHCEPYSWWKCELREKYPSTLFVTVTSIDPPKLEPVFYGQLTLDTTMSDEQLDPPTSKTITTEAGNLSRWSRLSAQSCKIPNEIFFKTDINENGCFYVVFSNNGKYLACANYDEYDYSIVVYKIDEEKVYTKFVGHKNFIYALDWSNNDEILLSVSSDHTARLWDVKNKIFQEINMLPHPSYVYCGKFDPRNYHFIVTGCYDHVMRLWLRRKTSLNYELIQELDGHEGFVNSICFLKDGDFLTADGVGVIIQWTVKKKKGKLLRDWQIAKKIKIREIKNIIINTIVLHPLGSRLLVHSRDNGLRILDLETGVVLQRYLGLKNSRIQVAARISPCGGLLLCGGEDATLNIWSLESCKLIAKYSTNLPSAAVVCVDYHPYDHVLVYSIFGVASETIVLRYNKQSNGESVGLKLLTSDHHNFHGVNNIEESIKSSVKSKQRFSRRIVNNSDKLVNEEIEKKSNVVATNGSREDLRYRLKMFNDSESQLKTRSANRLTSIIAKIDRILSNSASTHRSPYDIEANGLDEKIYHERRIKHSENEDNVDITRPYVPPLFSTFEDNPTSISKSDIIEMSDMTASGNDLMTLMTTKRVKSKSARDCQITSGRHDGEETSKTLSDSAMAIVNKPCKKSRRSHKKLRNVECSSSTVPMTNDFINTKTRQSTLKDERDESSAESGGTYVLDKSDIGKIIESESSSSVRSDVTFVIESEKPKPKPRRKHISKHETIVQIE